MDSVADRGEVTRGSKLKVDVRVTNRSPHSVELRSIDIEAPKGWSVAPIEKKDDGEDIFPDFSGDAVRQPRARRRLQRHGGTGRELRPPVLDAQRQNHRPLRSDRAGVFRPAVAAAEPSRHDRAALGNDGVQRGAPRPVSLWRSVGRRRKAEAGLGLAARLRHAITGRHRFPDERRRQDAAHFGQRSLQRHGARRRHIVSRRSLGLDRRASRSSARLRARERSRVDTFFASCPPWASRAAPIASKQPHN